MPQPNQLQKDAQAVAQSELPKPPGQEETDTRVWDKVDEASWESFPASDPPGTWRGQDRDPSEAMRDAPEWESQANEQSKLAGTLHRGGAGAGRGVPEVPTMGGIMEIRMNRQDGGGEMGQRMQQTAAEQRRKNQQMARQFSDQAMQQWQRSIEGLLALPTASALSLASGTMYAAALVERGFEAIERVGEALRSAGEEVARQMESKEGREGSREARIEGEAMAKEETEWPANRREARA